MSFCFQAYQDPRLLSCLHRSCARHVRFRDYSIVCAPLVTMDHKRSSDSTSLASFCATCIPDMVGVDGEVKCAECGSQHSMDADQVRIHKHIDVLYLLLASEYSKQSSGLTLQPMFLTILTLSNLLRLSRWLVSLRMDISKHRFIMSWQKVQLNVETVKRIGAISTAWYETKPRNKNKNKNNKNDLHNDRFAPRPYAKAASEIHTVHRCSRSTMSYT